MECRWTKARVGRYVDLDLGLIEETLVRMHLARCADCYELYERYETVPAMLEWIPEPSPSPHLGVKIRSAISKEALRADRFSASWNSLKVNLGNLMRPFAVPALGGTLAAFLLLPALLSTFWIGPAADADDIPLRLLASPIVTAPTMSYRSPYPVARDFTVIAFIDDRGCVYDYRVAGDEPLDQRAHGELGNALLTSKFLPALHFGKPIPGQRVIHYHRIDSRA